MLAWVAAVAVIALWSWGVGFWMGTYFVPRTVFDSLVSRVIELEKRIR
jgi:hypothetical protein